MYVRMWNYLFVYVCVLILWLFALSIQHFLVLMFVILRAFFCKMYGESGGREMKSGNNDRVWVGEGGMQSVWWESDCGSLPGYTSLWPEGEGGLGLWSMNGPELMPQTIPYLSYMYMYSFKPCFSLVCVGVSSKTGVSEVIRGRILKCEFWVKVGFDYLSISPVSCCFIRLTNDDYMYLFLCDRRQSLSRN